MTSKRRSIHSRSRRAGRCRSTGLLALLLAVATLASALDPHKDLSQYGRRSWQTDSGLPQNTVHAVIQTHDGYIWLATEGGLVRFDGVEFLVYGKQAPAHLSSSSVNGLFEDANGDLWIGTDDGLVRRSGDEFTTFTTANGLPSNTISSFFHNRAGNGSTGGFWVVTPNGLAHYRNGSFQAVAVPESIANAKSVAESPDGSLWIGTHAGLKHLVDDRIERATLLGDFEIAAVAVSADGRVWAGTRTGLYSFTTAGPSKLAPLAGLPSSEITALTVGHDGTLWIGTAKGFASYRNGAAANYVAQNGLPMDRVESRVESIWEDREGAVWIAGNRGLTRVFDGHAQSFGPRDGLSGGLVLSGFEDREGSLWLGTESSGVEMLHDQKFASFTTADGLSDDVTRSVFQDRDGVVWVGTNGGGLDRFDHGRFTSLTAAKGLSSDIVLALAGDAAGNLWVGTPDGLNEIDRAGKIRTLTSADGLVDDFVRSLYAAADGSMWIGTRRGLSHLKNGQFTNYSSMDGLGSDLVGAIVEGRDHTLWISTLGGLTRFDHRNFRTLTTRDGLSSNVITALYQDQTGTLWIGTNQGGLNRLHDGKITAYAPEQTHLPESIYAILSDAQENLWLSSKTGIYRVPLHQLNDFADRKTSFFTPDVFGTADGMKIRECSSGGHPAAWTLADGAMWFATLRGIAAVAPEHLLMNRLPPPVAIEHVLVNDEEVATTGALIIPAGRNRFEFHYAGMSFIAPQKVHYRYKLEGFDRDWVDAGARRIAYYTNLPPAKYRFRVLASNNDGVWNETGANVDFRLQPHFYQSYWFYLAMLAGLALLTYQVYRWRLRQAQLRFDAVLSERGRIAREIHDTLAQGLVGISVQLELVNRLLSSSIESARAQLDQARSLVRGSLTEARSSIWDLRSQAAETEDFATRLSRMATAATEGAVPRIKVKSKVSGTYRPLVPRAEAELLRIAQEAVTNAVRHAKPEHIAIEVRFGPRELQMTIQDDGCGFDGQPHPQSSGPEGHFGLTGMRERAEQIGGTFSLDSNPGKGTEVSVHLVID